MHRHAQEQLTCSQHLTVLPSLSDPTKQTCCPRSRARTRIQALISALITGSTATGKPCARPKCVSEAECPNVGVFSPLSFFFLSTLTDSASFCDFLKLSFQLLFFPLKYKLICFSFYFTSHYIMHACLLIIFPLWSFFSLFFSEPLCHFHFNDRAERSCYTCLAKLWDLLFTNEIVHREQN